MPPESLQPVRQPLFDGYRAVRALWFDLALLGDVEARRRVLARWEHGARLFLVDDGYLLEWPRAHWHQVEALDGLALCEVGHVLSSAPLAPGELAQLDAGAWWLVRGAHAHAALPQARVDPSAWLDLRAVALREPLSPPGRGAVTEVDLAAPLKPLADILGAAMPTSSPRRDAFMRAAQQPAVRRGAGMLSAAAMAAAMGTGAAGMLGGLLVSLLKRQGQGQGAVRRGEPWTNPLGRLAARLAMFTRVSHLLGWRQANYLRKMLAMFEQGDLAEALRHAIALGGANPAGTRPALGTPQARSRLDISGARSGAATIGLDGALEAHLRATYRRTFERLDQAGRIDEAVFVLAELLRCGAEAVTYLESKGRHRQAAQLADTLDLAPELRVRLWLLAGEPARAIGLARLHNSFADVVRQLEKVQSIHAAPLRVEWANFLAARGDLAEAVDAIWPLPVHHDLARTWLSEAQRAGGTLGMRALARTLALLPDALASCQGEVTGLLSAIGADGAQLRARLATELLALSIHSAATRRLSALLARHVIAERQLGQNQLDQNALTRLVELGGAAVLRADLPSLKMPAVPVAAPLSRRSTVLELTLAERALLPIHDAVRLPDGHYLLALGEGGAVRINARGKQLAHYPVPAYFLVLADGGQRALALAQRDASYRVSRIDLIAGKVADWLSVPLQFWSGRYDGVTWNVVLDGRLVAIDTTAASLVITWQVADLPGAIIGYNDAGPCQSMLLAVSGESVEQWSYAQPGRQLRQRDAWDYANGDWRALRPNPTAGTPWQVTVVTEGAATRLSMVRLDRAGNAEITLAAQDVCDVQIEHNWWLITTANADGATCRMATADGTTRATVTFTQTDHARIRMQDDHFLAFDRVGRLVDIDSRDGTVTTLSLS